MIGCRRFAGSVLGIMLAAIAADTTVFAEYKISKGRYLIYPEEFSGGTGLHTIIRDFFGNWGTWRIPIHPVPGLTNTFGRDGFFFHGGEHKGSAGCINLQHCDIDFHDLLANHAGPINVTVNYSGWQPF